MNTSWFTPARRLTLAVLLATTALAAPLRAAAPAAGVAWQDAATDADIERAFARARNERKPLLLYWGARWCPPCNQLKATLFNRQDFITQSRAFVAVHVDGDRPGAQKLGSRFRVSGYPTLVLMSPAGTEITRLPGEVDAPQVMQLLQLGLAGGRPVKAVLADARAGRPIGANEWRLLAFYSWETDEERLLPQAELQAVLAKLAAASPAGDADTSTRLWLKALAAREEDKPTAFKPDAALRERVLKLLADPVAARAQMDVLSNNARSLALALATPEPAANQALRDAFDEALFRFQADATLSRADRMSASIARVELARLDLPRKELHPKLSEPLLADVRAQVVRADREITDGYERQAVITAAGYLLGRAGLWDESDALLKAGVARSHSPYYLMSQLGGNARKLGRKDEALRWYEEAFDKSEGPATRLQWGASYLDALVDLAPQDAQRIERIAGQLFAEAGRQQGGFHERNAKALQRVGRKLVDWNADGSRNASLRRLQGQLDPLCRKMNRTDPQRAACETLLKPTTKESKA
jgi:thioredoxin-related protein